MDAVLHYFKNLWGLHAEMAPWLLMGFAVAAAMGQLIRPSWWLKHLGGSDHWTHLKAVLVGIPLPLCSCSVIPTGVGLRKVGASRSSTLAFLTATPQTGVDSIAVTAGVLGWPFALAKVLAALVMGWVSGALAAIFLHDDKLSPATDTEVTSKPSFKEAWQQGFVELPWALARPYTLGLILSVLLTSWLPPQSLASYGAGPWSEMLFALVISLPMYVCATSSVPIALMLMHQGLGYGAVLVFLMAGPASNLSTMMVIAKTLGWKTFLIYFAVLVLGCLGIGYLLELTLSAPPLAEVMQHEHLGWFSHVAGVALLLMFLPTLIPLKKRTHGGHSGSSREERYELEGLSCMNCVKKLTDHLQSHGIEVREMTPQLGRLWVPPDVNVKALAQDLGFGAVLISSEPRVEEKTPCCSSGCGD